MDVQTVIKFTRCPRCHSFSLEEDTEGKTTRIPGLFSKNMVICTNCGNQYVLQGNNLKETASPAAEEEKKPDGPIPGPAPAVNRVNGVNGVNGVNRQIKSRPFNRTALYLIVIACFLAAGVVLLLLSHNPDQGNAGVSRPAVEEKTAPDQSVKETAKTSEISAESAESAGSETLETPETMAATPPQETREAGTVKNEEPAAAPESGPEESLNTPGESRALAAGETSNASETPRETETANEETTPTTAGNPGSQPTAVTGNEAGQGSEPTAYKLFDPSGFKIRSSSPDSSDPSRRWYFARKNITIKRSEDQRVVIAGDPTGKHRWAVDDEILINGEIIKGYRDEITAQGTIPESQQMPPVDITHLVPSNREARLDIRLVDYGIFWGNTSLYIVVI